MLPKIFDDLHVCSMVWMFQLQKWVSPTILPQTNMAPSQDMFNILDNLPTTLIFLGGNCWFEGHYTFPLMATMISVMSESKVWRKTCPIKTEQFNWISPPNRTPNSPPNKNNRKIMENHFARSWKKWSFVCSLDLGNFPDLSPMNLRCRRYPSSLDAALPYDSSLCGITTCQFLGRCYSYSKGNWRTNVQPECFLWKYLGLMIYDTDFFCLIILNVKYPNVFCFFRSKGSSFI